MSKKILTLKKTPLFPLFFVVAALLITLGVFLLPVWEDTKVFWKSWGAWSVNLIMFVIIVLYIALFLVKRMMRERKESIKMLMVAETVIFAVIALGCMLEQFRLINVGGPCVILGVALWIRGSIGVIKGYLFRHTAEEHKFTPAELAIAIALVTFGTVLMVRPIFTELHLIWIMSIVILAVGALAIAVGILSMPEKKAKPAAKSQ